MKKILTIFIGIVLILNAICFAGCSNGNDTNGNGTKNQIELSLSNYETYLQISSVRVYGSGYSTWSSYTSSYHYDKATGTASIEGVSGYEYIDVTVDIEIEFHYGDEYYTIDLPVKLNIGGSGSRSNDVDIKGSWPNLWIQKYAGYSVKSVTGYVQKA